MNLRDRLTGLFATVAILAILVGMPVILIGVGANPFAGTSWSLHWLTQALTTRDDGTLAIAVFKLAGWIVWAILAATILIELAARLRNVRAPRLPGLRLPQHAAQTLVAAAVLLFITTPTIAHATPATNPGSSVPQAQVAQHITPAATVQTTRTTPALPETPVSTTVVKHTVKQGETLWSIAEHYLGDGAQYKQIAAANATLLQGRPGFLLPGWVLSVPLPATTQSPNLPVGTYLVRKGDTLSRIAQTQLGDASRWPEIYHASTAIVQPGGAQLSDPDLIDIGWTLQIPTTPAPAVQAPTTTTPATPEPTAPSTTPTANSTAPTVAAPEVDAQAAATNQQAPEPTTAQSAPTETTATPAVDEPSSDSDWTTRTGYGVSALLAAGLVGLLIRRRRHQQRRRRLGQRLPAPTAAATQIEQELRATADEISVDAIDQTLRRLARTCTQNGTPLPHVRAARLTATQFDLYLAATPTVPLPAPWTATTDQTVWTLHATDIPTGTDTSDLDTVPAPYPALVTIGQDDEQGHVLLNLEQLGALGIVGAEHDTREVLAALALELALSAWADDLQVTLVGAFPDLEDVMHTGRIRYLPTLSRILDDLTHRANHDRHTLTTADTDLNTARVTATAPDTWQPEIVLVASPLTERQRTQLNDLVTATPRVALATVTHGLEIGHWGLDLTAGTSPLGAVLRPIGLRLDPQRLPAAQYSQLLDIVTLTDVDELHPDTPSDELSLADIPTHTDTAEPAAETTEPQEQSTAVPPLVEEAADPHLSPAERSQEVPVIRPPRLLMLGPLDLQDAQGSVEPSKRARLLEYATYLALHPGAAFSAIDNAIWPDRKTESNLNTRNTATSKLRRWLGADPDGKDYLPRTEAGAGYRFLPTLATDVQDWDQLVGNDPLNTPTENLEKALRLVRGIPFEGAHPKRYGWADPHRQRLISEIVDASYELGKRRLMVGKWRAAEEAVVIGLRIEPAQEMLWRLRILAAHESRNPAAEIEAIDRLLAITEQLECDLEPETEQLLADLKHHGTDRDRLLIAL